MKEVFNLILFDLIKPRLKDIGFKVSGNTFRRQENDFLIIFDIWKSSWNNANEILFWFETGVFRDSFYNFIFQESPPKTIRTNQCSMRLQAGSILRKGVPGYNYCIMEKNMKTMINEIANDLDNSFIPFLMKLKKIEDILIFGELDPVFCDKTKLFVGFGLAENGEKGKAETLINEYLQAAHYPLSWLQRIKSKSKSLNLNINRNNT